MIEWASLLSAFLLGLLSSAHCVGMCGGIMGALVMAIPAEARQRRVQLVTAYNIGRVLSYALMGAITALFAGAIIMAGGAAWLRILAGLLLIAMGLYLANWWRGLTRLETLGRYLWVYLQPLGKGLLPVRSLSQAFFLGALWGWLPCGLVYTALAFSMTHGNIAPLLMLAFGLGTLPAVMATGLAAERFAGLLQKRSVRTGFALLIIAFGIWTLAAATGHHNHDHSDHSDHSDHTHHGHETSTENHQHHDVAAGSHDHHVVAEPPAEAGHGSHHQQ
jgi:sulfite exporter TauE/SafE